MNQRVALIDDREPIDGDDPAVARRAEVSLAPPVDLREYAEMRAGLDPYTVRDRGVKEPGARRSNPATFLQGDARRRRRRFGVHHSEVGHDAPRSRDPLFDGVLVEAKALSAFVHDDRNTTVEGGLAKGLGDGLGGKTKGRGEGLRQLLGVRVAGCVADLAFYVV